MKEPVMIDTSVWIDFFKGSDTPQVNILTEYLETNEKIYLCPIIIQEILQGISNDNQSRKIKKYLMCFRILNDDSLESAIGAVKIYRNLRKKGISIRKSNDCLIAHYALKYSLKIIHDDRDFDMIFKHY